MTNPGKQALQMAFLWHMHQPDYRDAETGRFVLPWVYLHALKDYSDMAAHLEAHPGVRAVVNFVPSLVEQLLDYGDQFQTGRFRDPLLELLARPDYSTLDGSERRLLVERCFHSNQATMIQPFAPYKRLYEARARCLAAGQDVEAGFSDAMLGDLIAWYHLAWMGETVRRGHKLYEELATKGEGFTASDRARLLEVIGKVLRGILPRYRALAERGQIELSATPFSHPLSPLLISFESAREAVPNVALPVAPCYPGGAERVRTHVAMAMANHARCFGAAPQGMWPAEGAVSEELLALLAETPVAWVATSASVLANSLRKSGADPGQVESHLNFGYRLKDTPRPALFFRNEELSDLIGFEYKGWWASDAATDLVARLDKIRAGTPEGEPRLVSIILDGENAWEHYPFNGFYFFKELYTRLEGHPGIQTTTYSDYLAQHGAGTRTLDRLAAGSWVYGNFLKWIGSPDKNRGWDLLCAAKDAYDKFCAFGAPPATERILRGCESSDWFWWFGDFDPMGGVAAFDALFRHNLRALYRAFGAPPPATLDEPVTRGAGSPASQGTMRRSH